ncbi:hypothetical protein F4859DRAFT_513972 [Xylaria cf. heliscus]|nr:hypothetical protein F4859DRAFT_513972 [Xylaria cf. heliscus]
MKPVLALALTLFAAVAIAAPLNINLGAYSPALVVGDGAIGFGAEGEAAAEVLPAGDVKREARADRVCAFTPALCLIGAGAGEGALSGY